LFFYESLLEVIRSRPFPDLFQTSKMDAQNMTYLMPQRGHSKIQAFNFNRKSSDEVVVTIYYPRGKIRFTRRGMLPRWARLIHTEHENHTADLHKAVNPFQWHAHVVVPSGKELDLAHRILTQYSGEADKHISRIRSRWEEPPQKENAYRDGSLITYILNTDKSGLGLLADLDLRNAKNLSSFGKSRLIAEAAMRMRPTSAEQIVVLLLTYLPKEMVAAWKNPVDGTTLAHYAVCSGAINALDILLSQGTDIDAVRKRDRNTIAHLAAHQHKKFPSVKSAAILKRVLEENPDMSIKNKYGETAQELLDQ